VSDPVQSGSLDWKPVPGDDGYFSKGSQIMEGMKGRVHALPPAIQQRVLSSILPPDEGVVASQEVGRAYVSGSTARTMKLGFGAPTWPFLAATRARLLLFYVFAQDLSPGGVTAAPLGVDQFRQYLDLQLGGGVTLSPYSRGSFTIGWGDGLQLQVFYTPQPTTPFFRSGPIKAFYAALSGIVGSSEQLSP
jgi:hypothetical protein